MDLLGILLLIGISVFTSAMKSKDAKRQRERRLQNSKQTVYRSTGSTIAAEERKKPVNRAGRPSGPGTGLGNATGDVTDSLENLMGDLGDQFGDAAENLSGKLDQLFGMLGMEQEQSKQGTAKQETAKKPPAKKQPVAPVSGRKKGKKTAAQTAQKSPATLPTKTLMEQRPDREQREEYTKVSASVKPLKDAYTNDEHCEHRIELNPNIHYSRQNAVQDAQRAAIVKTDGESIVQGIIWSEILGKPKAYRQPGPPYRR